MKSILIGLLAVTVMAGPLFAQQPSSGRPGPPGFGDPARRLEMMVDRLAEDLQLNRSQQRELLDLFLRAQASAKPIQDELHAIHSAIKNAVKAGKGPEALDDLHQQAGAASGKLSAIRSAAFADAWKTLTPEQQAGADVLYDMLGMVAGPAARGGPPSRGGPGGFGPEGQKGSPGDPPRNSDRHSHPPRP